MRRPQLPLTLASARASVSVRTPSVSRVSVTVNLSFSCSILLPAPSLLRSFRLPSSSLGESTLKGRLFHSLTHSLTRRRRPWETDCENVSRQRHRFHSILASISLPSFRSPFLQFCTLITRLPTIGFIAGSSNGTRRFRNVTLATCALSHWRGPHCRYVLSTADIAVRPRPRVSLLCALSSSNNGFPASEGLR